MAHTSPSYRKCEHCGAECASDHDSTEEKPCWGEVMIEFDYDGKPKESFPFDQSKERYSMWLLKTHVLPRL